MGILRGYSHLVITLRQIHFTKVTTTPKLVQKIVYPWDRVMIDFKLALSLRKSMHIRVDPSFFFTRRIGWLYGLVVG